jgi:hypothetical protein
MARTVIPLNAGARDTLINLGTIAASLLGVAIDQANGHIVTPKKLHRLAILIYNSKVSAIQVTIAAGIYPPAENAGQGALVAAGIPTVALSLLTGFTGARFAQAGGSLFLDTDAGATGYIWAVELPA